MAPEASKKRFNEQYRKRDVIDWSDGEREALIAEALARGKARQIAKGVSGYDAANDAGESLDDKEKA